MREQEHWASPLLTYVALHVARGCWARVVEYAPDAERHGVSVMATLCKMGQWKSKNTPLPHPPAPALRAVVARVRAAAKAEEIGGAVNTRVSVRIGTETLTRNTAAEDWLDTQQAAGAVSAA